MIADVEGRNSVLEAMNQDMAQDSAMDRYQVSVRALAQWAVRHSKCQET